MKLITLLLSFSLQFTAQTPLVIKNITVIDMTGRKPQTGMTVVISDGWITAMGKSRKAGDPGATVIDGSGKFLIPALWDMHVHIRDSDRMLPLFVANGVLEVRDLGVPNTNDLLRWKTEAAAGKLLSPRIRTAGRVLDGDPPANREFSIVVKNADEARKAVRDLKARGADLIKVYDNLSRDAFFAIADETKALGLTFVGHTPAAVSTVEAVAAGQRTIEHLGWILEESSSAPERLKAKRAEPIKEGDFFAFTTRLGGVFDIIGETYDPLIAEKIFSKIKSARAWQVPTLVTKRSRTEIDELDARGDPRSKYVEASQRNNWKPSVGFFSRYRTPSYIAAAKKHFQREIALVGEMHRYGLGILAGTDTPAPYVIAGFALHEELELLVRAGLTPMEALQAATRNPAEYSGDIKDKGTIERGKLADLILLEADPLRDIRNTTRINAVIYGGRLVTRTDLDKILEQVESAAAKQN